MIRTNASNVFRLSSTPASSKLYLVLQNLHSVFQRFYLSRFQQRYLFAFRQVGEYAETGIGGSIGFHIRRVKGHQLIPLLHCLPIFHKYGKTVAFQIDRINADMQHVLPAVFCSQTHGVLRFKNKIHRAVCRCEHIAVSRLYHKAVSVHLFRKHFVRCFRNRTKRSGKRTGKTYLSFFQTMNQTCYDLAFIGTDAPADSIQC